MHDDSFRRSRRPLIGRSHRASTTATRLQPASPSRTRPATSEAPRAPLLAPRTLWLALCLGPLQLSGYRGGLWEQTDGVRAPGRRSVPQECPGYQPFVRRESRAAARPRGAECPPRLPDVLQGLRNRPRQTAPADLPQTPQRQHNGNDEHHGAERPRDAHDRGEPRETLRRLGRRPGASMIVVPEGARV